MDITLAGKIKSHPIIVGCYKTMITIWTFSHEPTYRCCVGFSADRIIPACDGAGTASVRQQASLCQLLRVLDRCLCKTANFMYDVTLYRVELNLT